MPDDEWGRDAAIAGGAGGAIGAAGGTFSELSGLFPVAIAAGLGAGLSVVLFFLIDARLGDEEAGGDAG